MTINLADNTPRVSYAVAQGATQTSFTVSFEFFDAADLNVYVDGTLKTITTHYTVSGGDGSTGTVTMSVTGATGGSTVVITRDIDLKRTTDFPASGSFQIGSLNTELDKLVAIAADLDDKASRALQLTDFDTAVSLVLPDVNTRKGKTLAFNASTGAVEAGPSTSDVQTVSATAADIATLADIEDGTDATDAIQTVAGIASNVTTVAGVSSNVTTVAGQTTNMQNITDNLSAVQNAATNATTATTKASEAATSATNAASSATSAASSATTATTKASEASTSATNAASSASTASGHKDTATTKASEAASSATAAAASASTASTQASNASTSASTASTQATNSATSATASATSATASATSATAAASSATAAASSQTAAASSAAAAATALDSFDDRYLGVKSSNPSVDNDGNALVSGALYFSDSANEMRVYDGANWIAATSAGNVSLILYEYTATAGQTTFSGSDDNSATLSYTVDNLQVVMNGIVLDPSDYTATNGTSVVLASGAATNDLINIYAFKSFTTADMVSKTNGGTFAGAVTVPQLNADNIRIDGNTISSTDTNGDITLDPNGSGDVVVAQVASSSLDIEGDRTDAQITLKGGSAGAGIQLFGSTYTNYAGAMYLDATASTTGTNDAEMVFRTGSSPSEAMRIDRSGNVTMANQPSVSARATATNLAVGSQTTLTLDNERYDIGSNLASNTFTAPVTGKYLFTYTLYFVDVDTANTALGVQVITSNTQYENWISPDHIGNSDFFYTATSAQIADMDVNDTLQFKVYVSAGAAQTDVHGDSKISIALLS
jgi:chemotaxis protein histidine kinase CheA